MGDDPTIVAKLSDLLGAIKAHPDPRRAAAEWKQVFKLLGQAGVPAPRATGVVGMRDVSGLAAMVEQLQAPAGAVPEGPAHDPEVLRKALLAFRKRMSLTVLDEESKLGHSPLSKGAGADTPAIIPPDEWPAGVWQELARQGRLKYIGHGFYELPR
jgi:hypothetical protein